ncbi:MAG: CehA/McbA family metallohydrolase, partial [Planctomycetes bacterium]|nr:CehA/McbA family metallohydrolase [Planctomycetota bacterium]
MLFCFVFSSPAATAADFPQVTKVERQPLVAATKRLVSALNYIGAPLAKKDAAALEAAMTNPKDAAAIAGIQKVLDKYCVVGVHISAESRVKVADGPAQKELVQQGWRTFLVKVYNKAGITPELKAASPSALPIFMRGSGRRQRPLKTQKLVPKGSVRDRFLDIHMYVKQPLKRKLSGLQLEYRIIQLFSRDAGRREAKLAFNVGQGTQDIGFRNAVPILFNCLPSVQVTFGVKDFDGSPTMASFVIRDKIGHIYPNPARRLAPDFFFHNQIYRTDGESVDLPAGEYTVAVNRGPEYFVDTHTLVVKAGVKTQTANFKLRRWIHAAKRNWFSGDHHVHAAGCAHYDSPTEGVKPSDMMRHILGEDLNVGCVLSWGPCWYTQKQYFEGKVSALSTPNYLMRYDVEVSGFPSSHAGHLCLLRLKEDDYPGTTLLEQWPSWTLPVLAWGKKQGGVVGYSHSGWGLQLPDIMPNGSRQFVNRRRHPAGWMGRDARTLPDYAMPRFDGIGANEYIVTVTHGVCDFISAVDTPSIWELNIWYHTLNCGFDCRISGETDFPCIYGDKVGLGRIYVKLKQGEKLDFDTWIQGVKDGRSYCGDGLSHIFDFKVNDVAVGEKGNTGKISRLDLDKPQKVKVTFDVAALLAPKPTPQTEAIRRRRLDQKPYWHLERCRIGNTRNVPVELIVNGYAVARKDVLADGSTKSLSFDVEINQSSWVAVRILPSVHTNPVFVHIAGKPIRASKRSAEWCRKAVDVCWNSKKGRIRPADTKAAKAAYAKARKLSDRIIRASV